MAPLITSSAISFGVITKFAGSTLSSYFAKKGLDALFSSKEDFKEELRDVIDSSIVEYADRYPQDSGQLLPFYHSVEIINELMTFRIMHEDDYNPAQLIEVINREKGVMPPTEQNIKDFYDVFLEHIIKNEKLRKLEIKQTFEAEIFAVSKKIDALDQRLENMISAINGDLEAQWKSRLDAYQKTLEEFKPNTALDLLSQLEKSFETSTKKPNQKVLALIDYLKGLCHLFLNDQELSAKSYLAAYKKCPDHVTYKERAALAYYKFEDTKSLTIAHELLDADEYSAIGWAVKTLHSKTDELARNLKEVPTLVKKDPVFLRALFNTLLKDGKSEMIQILYQEGILPKFTDYKPEKITIDNYYQLIFWIFNGLYEYQSTIYIGFNGISEDHRQVLTFINERLRQIVSLTKGTEIEPYQTQNKFLLSLSQFMLTPTDQLALDVKKFYTELKSVNFFDTIHAANILQMSDRVQEAIDVIEESKLTAPEILDLLAYCYLKADNTEGHIKSFKRYLKELHTIPTNYVQHIVARLAELKARDILTHFSPEEMVQDLQCDKEEDQNLMVAIIDLLFAINLETASRKLFDLSLIQKDELLPGIARVFYFSDEFKFAVEVFQRFIDVEIESGDLYYYMLSLLGTKLHHKELLDLLKNWRLRFTFDPGFLRIEAQMRRDLLEWEEVVDICKHYLSKIADDEPFLTLYTVALSESGSTESLSRLAQLADTLSGFHFADTNNVATVARILVQNKLFEPGFELLFRYAQDPHQTKLRTVYFNACLTLSNLAPQSELLKEYQEVKEGNYVKYMNGGNTHFVEINEENIKKTPYDKFLGLKSGEVLKVRRPISNQEDSIRILRVMNKYLFLHDEILHQVETNPYSGLPMQSIKFNRDDPGGFFQQIEKMFGERGAVAKLTKENDLEKYYKYELSFTEIVVRIFQQNYLEGYMQLIFNNGIASLPLNSFIHQKQTPETYILDFSSLLMLYQISINHGITYSKKFIVSRYIVDLIKQQLKSITLKGSPDLTFTVIPDQVTGHVSPTDFHNNRIAFFTNLLKWISENCSIELSARTMDVIRDQNLIVGQNPVLDTLISTRLLTEDNKNGVLITEDIFFIKHQFLNIENIFSTEMFIKSSLGSDHPALSEFIVNKYQGYSPTEKQLNDEYTKYLASSANSYTYCLKNISAKNHTKNISVAIKHVKFISLNPSISLIQMKQDITNAFVGVLRGVTPDIKDRLILMITLECRLLGEKLDLIFEALENAFLILYSK